MMNFAARRYGITVSVLTLLCSMNSPRLQNTGNSKVASASNNAYVDTHTPLKYTTDELCDIVQQIDPLAAARIRAATDPQSGYICVYESFQPPNGVSDSGTIGLPTWQKTSKELCAIMLMHEFAHAERAHESDPGNPDALDPLMDGPCGKCAHAEMGAADYQAYAYRLCEMPHSDADRREGCARLKTWRMNLNRMLNGCWLDGCAGCCGKTYVPNADELITVPPCCNN